MACLLYTSDAADDTPCVDLGMLLMSALLIWSSIYVGKRNQIDRADGAILVILDIAYMAWLIIKG